MAVELRAVAGPHTGLVDWLAGHRVDFDVREHPVTYSAEATARAEHSDPRRFAKVVGVAAADGRQVLLLVDAPDHVDLAKARRVLGTTDVRILTEAEFTALAPDCEPGSIPPVPELFGVPVYADFALREVAEIAFHAGSHRFTAHVDRRAWERAAGVVWADLALDDGRPVWAR
jgi:Ala-tRNA(Pro) deacylase